MTHKEEILLRTCFSIAAKINTKKQYRSLKNKFINVYLPKNAEITIDKHLHLLVEGEAARVLPNRLKKRRYKKKILEFLMTYSTMLNILDMRRKVK